MKLKSILFVTGFVALSISASAQTTLASAENSTAGNHAAGYMILHSDDWSFYTDTESRVLFIDFEKIQVNLSDIIVKNEGNDEILKEDVSKLPVNTIFEIDFSKFNPGKYSVELRSYTGIIKREFEVK